MQPKKITKNRRERGKKTKRKTPSPNFEELIESITNMLLFFAGVCVEKSYEVSKLWGGGGGVLPEMNFLKKIKNIFFAT